jgi:hypothetical protein
MKKKYLELIQTNKKYFVYQIIIFTNTTNLGRCKLIIMTLT